jgi:hypothetical protein
MNGSLQSPLHHPRWNRGGLLLLISGRTSSSAGSPLLLRRNGSATAWRARPLWTLWSSAWCLYWLSFFPLLVYVAARRDLEKGSRAGCARRYQPEGQPFLRKHHDASTFSLNVALNRIGVDFEGGGTHFTRQNCTVLDNQMGHALIHPGRSVSLAAGSGSR